MNKLAKKAKVEVSWSQLSIKQILLIDNKSSYLGHFYTKVHLLSSGLSCPILILRSFPT